MDLMKIKNISIRVLLVFSIIFFLYCLIFVKNVELYSELEKDEINESEEHQLDNMQIDNEIFVDNIDLIFEKYTGELTRLNVSKKIRSVTLTDLYVLKNTNMSKKYFNDNYTDIVTKYGITNYDELNNLYLGIQNYEENVSNISVVNDTVFVGDKYTSFKVKVTFSSGNYTILKFNINNIMSTNVIDDPNIVVLYEE